jgi:hypothetical protein
MIEQLQAFSPPTPGAANRARRDLLGDPRHAARKHLKTIIRQPAKGPRCGFAARESVGGLMRQADEREMLIVSS